MNLPTVPFRDSRGRVGGIARMPAGEIEPREVTPVVNIKARHWLPQFMPIYYDLI